MVMDKPFIHEIAQKLNKDRAQVLIAWVAKRGFAVINKSVTESRIKVCRRRCGLLLISQSNFQDFELNQEDFDTITAWGEKNQCRAHIPCKLKPMLVLCRTASELMDAAGVSMSSTRPRSSSIKRCGSVARYAWPGRSIGPPKSEMTAFARPRGNPLLHSFSLRTYLSSIRPPTMTSRTPAPERRPSLPSSSSASVLSTSDRPVPPQTLLRALTRHGKYIAAGGWACWYYDALGHVRHILEGEKAWLRRVINMSHDEEG